MRGCLLAFAAIILTGAFAWLGLWRVGGRRGELNLR
jgi:hypothetical protein